MELEYLWELGRMLWNIIRSLEKWKKEPKALKKQDKILYSIYKKPGSRSEIENTKKIIPKANNKSSNSSSGDLEYDSLLASNSSWETYRYPDGRTDMNRLDHVVTDNLKNYKD